MTSGYPCPCYGFITRGEEAPAVFFSIVNRKPVLSEAKVSEIVNLKMFIAKATPPHHT